MSHTICIVSATRRSKEDFWNNAPLAYSLKKMTNGIDNHVYYQNSSGLSEVYNRALEQFKGYYDYLVFVHDDVVIEDLFLDDKLEMGMSQADIIGLAGSKEMDLNAAMLAWHLMSPRESHCGEVAHSKDGKNWTTCFGSTRSPVLCLDGLFLAVNVKKLHEKQVTFDQSFKFHHYDLDFCCSAHKAGLKMAVMPIRVTHFGLGDSMNSKEWKDSGDLFRKKWNNSDMKQERQG
jgi:GT2 family glycosyltransferase